MSKRKYKQGHTILSLHDFIACLRRDRFVYCRNKIYHEGWVLSWQFRYVVNAINDGYINRAIKIKEKRND